MPAELPPYTAEDLRRLAARDGAEGYDTQVAAFFGADGTPEDDIPTEVDGGELGERARGRASSRKLVPKPLLG